MATSRLMSEIIADARQMADAEDDAGYFSDTELLRRANESAAEIHNLIAEHLGVAYQQRSASLTLTGGDGEVALVDGVGDPYRMAKIATIDFLYGGKLRPIQLGHWGMRHADPAAWVPGRVFYVPSNFASQVDDPRLIFFPPNTGDETIVISYVPAWVDLELADELILPHDWYRWVVLDLARMMRAKEDLSTRDLRAKQEEIEAHIRRQAPDLDQFQPQTVRDVEPVMADYNDFFDEADW